MSGYVPRPGTIPTLDVPDLADVRRVHMIGIGGAGMRNLARVFLARGIGVTGSDMKDSRGLAELRAGGASVWVGHAAEQVGEADAVVVSSAIREGNAELAEARRRGLPIWMRAQALAAAAATHRAIAVSGTHGKTTTTSMVALVLERAGLDPTYVIGGDPNETGSGGRSGSGDLFVAEADESDGSFLLMRPAVGIVTNVELDHVDFYPGGLAEIEAAFTDFAERCEHVVVYADDPRAVSSVRAAGVPTTTYGTSPGADVRLEVESVGPGGATGHVTIGGERLSLRIPVDGAHNLLDASGGDRGVRGRRRRAGRRRRRAARIRRRASPLRAPGVGPRGRLLRRLRPRPDGARRDARRRAADGAASGSSRCSSRTGTRGRRRSGASWARASSRPTSWSSRTCTAPRRIRSPA